MSNLNQVSNQTTTHHRGHQGVNHLTRLCRGRWKNHRTKYHYDYRGSTVALSADSGAVTDRIEYSAYGLTTYRIGTRDTPFLFNGKYGVQTDANGLLFMQARYYNPYLCRFVSADPSGFGGGLNHYAYANGNPVSLIDPFGLGAMGEMSGASWLASIRQQAIYDQLAGPKVTFDGIVNGLLGLAEDVTSTPWNMAYGMGGDINTAISGQDNAGNQVSGLRQTWAAASVLLTVVPIGDVVRGVKAAESGGANIALGAGNAGTRSFAQTIGANHLLDAPQSQWKSIFQSLVADPSTTFHVNMNGFFGETPAAMIMNEINSGSNTGWELLQLQNAGRLHQVNFYPAGHTTPILNPIAP